MKTYGVMGVTGIRDGFRSGTCDSSREKAGHCQKRGVRRGLMLPGGSAAGLVVLVLTVCAAMPLHASDLQPMDIALVESGGGKYFEPAERRIVIAKQPIRLFIRIRNTSDAAVMIRASPEKAYAIELKDEAGVTSIVKRKESTGGDMDDDVRVNLAPGADKIIPMEINRDTWEGVPDVPASKESKFTARVIYEKADRQHVYSQPYTLIFKISK